MSQALPSSLTGANAIVSEYNNAAAPNQALITITNQDAQTSIIATNILGQTIAATIGNEAAYFSAWYNNRATSTAPIVEFQQNEVELWNSSLVFFRSGNVSDGNRQQHIIRNWNDDQSGTFADSRSGAPEVLPSVEGLASIGTVIAAVDASSVASSVEDLVNYEGYRSQNPLLNGPNGGPIDNTTDYRNNIRRS